MRLSRIEQETIILFNEDEKTAIVETCNRTLRKIMNKNCVNSDLCTCVFADDVSAKYVCPKSWIKIQKPRVLTDKQRANLAIRARKNFGHID